MSPLPRRQSRVRSVRIIWASFLEHTCFGSSPSNQVYSSLSTDSLPLLSEKTKLYPTVDPSLEQKPLPSPPRLTRWPSTSNIKTRRSVLNVSSHNVASEPPQDERSIRASFDPRTRSRSGSTPETELTDGLSLMDTANLLGAVGGVVGAGYAGAAYHQQRRQERRREGERTMSSWDSEDGMSGSDSLSRAADQRSSRPDKNE